MVKIKYILGGVLVTIIGIVVFFYFFPNDERKVKKQFNLLSEWVTKSQDEPSFTMLQKIKNIGTLFDEHCELKVPSQSLSGSYTREEISTYAGSARSYFSQLDLKFYDFHIVFLEKGIANVTLTGRLAGSSTAGEQADETRELECVLKKIENKWLFSSIEIVEVLKR
jgi:hypothetical protein